MKNPETPLETAAFVAAKRKVDIAVAKVLQDNGGRIQSRQIAAVLQVCYMQQAQLDALTKQLAEVTR